MSRVNLLNDDSGTMCDILVLHRMHTDQLDETYLFLFIYFFFIMLLENRTRAIKNVINIAHL